MKVLVLFTVVAVATSAIASTKRVTKAITEEDDGQYHEDNSGDYTGYNSAYNNDVTAQEKSAFYPSQGASGQARSGSYQGGPYQVSSYQGIGAQVIPSQQFSRTSYNTYNNDGDDGQYHPNPEDDDGQYHEDNSGDYYSDNSGDYKGSYVNAEPYNHIGSNVEPYRHTPDQLFPYKHVGSNVEPYRHTPDQLVPYIPYSDAGSYKQVPDNGNYKQVPDKGNYKQVPDKGTYKQVPDKGNYKQVPDKGTYEQNPDLGNYKQVPDNGNYQQVPDNGNYKQLGDNGDYRQVGNSENYNGNDGKYKPDNEGQYVNQYSGKSSFSHTGSYSGSSGPNVVSGKVGQNADSSFVYDNQKVVEQSLVPPSFSKSVKQGQANDGQYHPDNSGNYNQKAVDGKYYSSNEGQYVGQQSGKSSFGQTNSYSGNSGSNVVFGKVNQHAGSSSVFGNQKVVGQNVDGATNDGQYHPDNSGNYNQKSVDVGKFSSGKSSFTQTSSYSGAPSPNVVPGRVNQPAVLSSVFGNQKVVGQTVGQKVVGQAVGGSSSYKSVDQSATNDGQYHPDNSGNYNQKSVDVGKYSSGNEGQHAGQYSGKSSFTQTSSYSGSPSLNVVPGKVSQPAGSLSVFGNQKVIGQTVGQKVVGQIVGGSSSYKSVDQSATNDGQYHADNNGNYNQKSVDVGKYSSGNKGQHAGQYSGKSSFTQTSSYSGASSPNIVPGKVNQPAGFSSVFDNQKVVGQTVGQKIVGQTVGGSSSYKLVDQSATNDGQYHPDNSGNYNQKSVDVGKYSSGNEGQHPGQYSGKSSFSQTSSYSGTPSLSVVPGKVSQPAGSSSIFGNQKVIGQTVGQKVVGQTVGGSSSYKSVDQSATNDGQYHADNSGNYNQKSVDVGKYSSGNEGQHAGQYSGKSSFTQTSSYSGASSPNVVPGKVNQPAGFSSVFGNQKVVGQTVGQKVVGQTVGGSSSYKSVDQSAINDGQYHPDNSGNYNQKSVDVGKYSSGNEGQHPGQYSGKSSFSQTNSYSGTPSLSVVPGKVSQRAGSSSIFGNQKVIGQTVGQKVVGQTVGGSSTYKSVDQSATNDGQYHADNSGNYNQKSVDVGKYSSGNEGQHAGQYSGKSSFTQTSSYSGASSPNVVPGKVNQPAGFSSVFGNQKVVGQTVGQKVVGQTVGGSSSYKSVDQSAINDGQYHPDNSGNYNQKSVDVGKYSSGNEGQNAGQYSGKSSFTQTSSYSGTPSLSVVPGKVNQPAGSSSVFGNQKVVGQTVGQKVVGQTVGGSSSYKSVDQSATNDGQYHPDNSGNYNQKSVDVGRYSSGNEGQHAGQYSGKSSFSQTSSYSGTPSLNVVPGKVSQPAGSSSVFGNQKVIGQTVGHKVVGQTVGGSSSYKSVDQSATNDGQYHAGNSGNYNQKSVDVGKYSSGNEGQHAGQYSGKSSFTQTSSYSGSSNPNVVPGKVSQHADLYSVFGNQKVVGQTVGGSFSNDGQYHPDNSGNYNQKSVDDGKYSSGNEGQRAGQYSGKSSFTQTSSYSGSPSPNVVPGIVSQPASSSSVFGNQKVGQQSGKSSFSQISSYSGSVGPNSISSPLASGIGGSAFQSKTVNFQNFKPVQTQQSYFNSYSEGESVKPGVQLVHQVFETVQPRADVVPFNIKDMQLIHSKIQTALSSKYGKHNEKFDEKHFGNIRQTEEFTNDGYHYMYETEKGIIGEEMGQLVGKGTDKVHIEVKGFYSYTGPDNVLYTVEYSADSLNGYLPKYSTVVKNAILSKGAKFCITK
ncbi:unnamed protein product [Psylliodes chrysocephalus]|uniref:Uncharacterized protein n=1 Tax=Psylliodes chrysocephalus TaxID=3402493 RepID=A0A9P0CV51_9CUCU|nr:unnamed protein product [Psylliodes chrysocephala]